MRGRHSASLVASAGLRAALDCPVARDQSQDDKEWQDARTHSAHLESTQAPQLLSNDPPLILERRMDARFLCESHPLGEGGRPGSKSMISLSLGYSFLAFLALLPPRRSGFLCFFNVYHKLYLNKRNKHPLRCKNKTFRPFGQDLGQIFHTSLRNTI